MVLRRKRSRYKGPLTTIYYNLGTATCYLLRARSLTFSKHEILIYLPSKGRIVHLIRSAKLQMQQDDPLFSHRKDPARQQMSQTINLTRIGDVPQNYKCSRRSIPLTPETSRKTTNIADDPFYSHRRKYDIFRYHEDSKSSCLSRANCRYISHRFVEYKH